MSSSRLPKSLRGKLIASSVALLAGLCVIIGIITELALGDFLMRQLDDDLRDETHRPVASDSRPGPGGPPRGIKATITNGVVDGFRGVPRDPNSYPLSTAERESLAKVPTDNVPHTLPVGDLGDFRLVSNGSRITGLPTAQVDDVLLQMGLIIGGLTLAGICLAGLAGRVIIRRTLVPLERVAATASRVSELPLHKGEVALAVRVADQDTDPDTEVGQVGLALNRMLGHIGNALEARHASETRVRQFVADASHELRTPLAAIRGYAELTRRTGEDVSPEIAHAMRRVESEAERMTALVEDLLLLARLDAGRPLEDAEVDLSRLVLDVVGDARIAGRDHSWKLELPGEPVIVQGDLQRLHQVLGNLLSNARTHTPPGTTVTTGLSVVDGHVELTVTDDGPGIPDGLEVFERFARGDGSRSRAAGSTGLGLSIVSAVVGAHHGTVGVASEPGRTTFTVRLRTAPRGRSPA